MRCGGKANNITRIYRAQPAANAVYAQRPRTPAAQARPKDSRGFVRDPQRELRHASMMCRAAAVNYLWRRDDLKGLVVALRSSKRDVRELATDRLTRIMSRKPTARQRRAMQKEIAPYLEGLLDSRYTESPQVKLMACAALGWLEDDGSVEILMHVAKSDGDPCVRVAAESALRCIHAGCDVNGYPPDDQSK